MKTLYDLLGALPDDDADDIRAAFRKAVKESHPDLNAGDPDTALRVHYRRDAGLLGKNLAKADPQHAGELLQLLAAGKSRLFNENDDL